MPSASCITGWAIGNLEAIMLAAKTPQGRRALQRALYSTSGTRSITERRGAVCRPAGDRRTGKRYKWVLDHLDRFLQSQGIRFVAQVDGPTPAPETETPGPYPSAPGKPERHDAGNHHQQRQQDLHEAREHHAHPRVPFAAPRHRCTMNWLVQLYHTPTERATDHTPSHG